MRLFSLSRVFIYRESGATLIETLVALFVLGTIAVIFLSGLVTTTKASSTTDERATAESLAQSQMEWAQNATYNATGYLLAPIPSSSDYTNYSANITVEPRGEGIQKITVIVSRSGEQVITLESYKAQR